MRAEYWIVDLHKERIWILTEPESENGYERAEFVGGQTIVSTVFPELALTVDEVLSPPPVEDLVRLDLQALEQESQRADTEYQRAEQENQRANAEYQRAEQAEQKAKKFADYLREQSIDPERI